jgi:hypothetical protein
MAENFSIIQWVVPVGLILGGLLIGLFIDKFVLRRLKRAVARTRWNGDEILISALGGLPILWLTLLGTYLALQSVPLSQSWRGFAKNALLVVAILSVTVFVARVAAGESPRGWWESMRVASRERCPPPRSSQT